jgi:uncharacterized protein YcfJ
MNKITLTAAAILTALATNASASSNSFRDSARVTNVHEIVKTYENRTPRQTCHTEQVAYQEPVSSGRKSHTGTILGAVIGGALGNELGHRKHNKQAGTAIGALLGGSIGRDFGRKPQQYVTRYRDEQRCNTTTEISYDERVVGYDVTYRYNGQSYTTRMQRDPGNSIKVKVAITPVK